jgi:hypothetical protein
MTIDELWMSLRSALLTNKIERIHSFAIRHSILAFLEFLFRLDRPFFWPAAGLTPETRHLKPNIWAATVLKAKLKC